MNAAGGLARPNARCRRPYRGAVWRIAPPLTVSTEEIDRAIAILDVVLRDGLEVMARGSEG